MEKGGCNRPSSSYCFVEGSSGDAYLSFTVLSNQAIPMCYLIYSMAIVKLFQHIFLTKQQGDEEVSVVLVLPGCCNSSRYSQLLEIAIIPHLS